MESLNYETYVNALIHSIEVHDKFNQDFEKFYNDFEKDEKKLVEKINEITKIMEHNKELSDESYDKIIKMDEECRNILSSERISEINNKVYEFKERYGYLEELRNKLEYLNELNNIKKDESVVENLEKYLDEDEYAERMNNKDIIYYLIDESELISANIDLSIVEFDLAVNMFNIKGYELLNFENIDSEYVYKK